MWTLPNLKHRTGSLLQVAHTVLVYGGLGARLAVFPQLVLRTRAPAELLKRLVNRHLGTCWRRLVSRRLCQLLVYFGRFKFRRKTKQKKRQGMAVGGKTAENGGVLIL